MAVEYGQYPSFPVRERGLKLSIFTLLLTLLVVVPRAGTWIETTVFTISFFSFLSFPVRERGLKHSRTLKVSTF